MVAGVSTVTAEAECQTLLESPGANWGSRSLGHVSLTGKAKHYLGWCFLICSSIQTSKPSDTSCLDGTPARDLARCYHVYEVTNT